MTLKYLMTLIQIFFFSSIMMFGGSAWAKNDDDLCKGKVVSAEVVAIEQAIVLNRYGAFNPAGMLYALQRDVVFSNHPSIPDGTFVTAKNLHQAPGFVKLRDDKRPRPLVLRVNEGDCLEVTFHNLLMPGVPDERHNLPEQYHGKVPAHLEDTNGIVYSDINLGRNLVRASAVSSDLPYTRATAFHVNGLDVVPVPPKQCPLATTNPKREWLCGTDGSNVGLNRATVNPKTPEPLRRRLEQQGGLIYPGQSAIYRMFAFREGTYFAYSTGATVGGEGNGGQLGAGLFGAVNVQPRGSKWYRSQVTHEDLRAAARPVGAGEHPYANLDYDGARYTSGPFSGTPILAMLDDNKKIVHSDLNAVIVLTGQDRDHNDTTGPDKKCEDYAPGNSCGLSYREFTVIMHDEVEAVQAFAELEDEANPLHYIKDGMGINYGVAGMGAMVVARNRRVGPVRNCPECRAEEFFLSSWANGDPALILRWGDDGKKPVGAMYPDDPSNVHHSYLNDPVRFRNIHAGPKETHVFHLHAHQWMHDTSNPGSTYLDSQTISPGATFSYEIAFGGSGNRNHAPGDSIFHCHLYPHFAQGMWELWRVHDVFEDGSEWRKLRDAEVAGGTENPAIVPIPGSVMALMPTEDFRGYPFYIAGEEGHRPPQPPLDMDKGVDGKWVDGGLQRHVLKGGWGETGNNLKPALGNPDIIESALFKGSLTAQINARRVYSKNPNALTALAGEWEEITENGIKLLKPEGEEEEKNAMAFHEGVLEKPGFIKKEVPAGSALLPRWTQTNKMSKGYLSHWAKSVAGQTPHPEVEPIFLVNGRPRTPGAPFSDPCPVNDEQLPQREYKVGVIQTELTVNRHGWFDPQARILVLEQDIKDIINPNTRDRLPEPLFFRANSGDCINFKHSNFVPNALALDDFQIYTPTDTIGQHIHLVKFDVTSSDGSGNGWNYEDGTFSPEEVRERIFAYNRAIGTSGRSPLKLKTHPLFEAPCTAGDKNCEALKVQGTCPPDADSMSLKQLAEKHPFCGAQRTVQRWYADPILDSKNGRDYTLRTVFTHDHFGPSSHQQHGLYAALVIEPSNSVWLSLDANSLDWSKLCGNDEHDRETERKKVMGGANLSNHDVDGLCSQDKRAYTEVVGAKELRSPLKIREDGGPTATRANIVSPLCLSNETNGGSHKNSNPLDPQNDPKYQIKNEGKESPLLCPEELRTTDTRREYALAFADFAILYNTALEPINPEQRDVSGLRFGRRQVAINNPMPLGISSEDPGTQLINYRNEPIPLRVTDLTVDPVLGGFNAQQTPCKKGDSLCTGDMANVFSTEAHQKRDRKLATQSYSEFVHFSKSVPLGSNKLFLPEATRQLLEGTPVAGKLDQALDEVEAWRRDFSCALYSEDQLSEGCRPGLQRLEPWREIGDPATPILAAYEGDPLYVRLIQGAQEAQHVFAMTGNKWLKEPDNPNSGYTNAQPLGISEHFEFDIDIGPADGSAPRVDMMYYGSSVDQLWDGMWGLVRSYGSQLLVSEENKNMLKRVNAPGVKQLNFPGAPVRMPAYEKMLGKSTNVCLAATNKVYFDISAVHACDLTQTCGEAKQKGVPYNHRLGIDDPHAIVFVRNNRLPNAEEAEGFNHRFNNQILSDLQQDVKAKRRRIEPLVLRAPAGACMEVQIRNHLREPLFDSEVVDGMIVNGPIIDGQHSTEHFSDNFMSMILDGFNYNQLRMSSSVGLAAPMVARFSLSADGANFGINSTERSGFPQANLVRTCAAAEDDKNCKLGSMRWYAGNYAVDSSGTQLPQPIEFGALPLSSFGDVIKHPAHGLIGALVIGPEGSKVCPSKDEDERKADQGTDTSATICDKKGKRLYRDFVLVLQDAVDAKMNDDQVANLKGAEEPDDYGIKAVNYRTEPLWGRRGLEPSVEFEERNEFDYANVLSSKMVHNNASSLPLSREEEHKLLKLGKELDFAKASKTIRCQAGIKLLFPPFADRYVCDPETPVFVARAGGEIRLRVVHPGGHTRQQAFTLHGHDWNPAPWKDNLLKPNANHVEPKKSSFQKLNTNHAESIKDSWIVQGSYNGIGPMMAANLLVHAGGRSEVPMDYLWRSQASFIFDGGIWGLLRVLPPKSKPSAFHKH